MNAPLILIVALILAGLILGLSGVYTLFGAGWTLMAAAAACIALAIVIARGGLKHG